MTTEDYLRHARTGELICSEQNHPLKDVPSTALILISLGNVDGKKKYIQKNTLSELVPLRYRKEKIDPRPYYSKNRTKRTLELIDNFARDFFRAFCSLTNNLSYTVKHEETIKNLEEILSRYPLNKIILVSTSQTDERYFPGARIHYKKTNEFLRSYSNERIIYFNLQEQIEPEDLLLDKFHLNEKGHKKIAKSLEKVLKAAYLS